MITKSLYTAYVKCELAAWYDVKKTVKKDITEANRSRLKEGAEFGLLAQNYFGPATVIKFRRNKQAMMEETQIALSHGVENIAEATFFDDEGYCQVDILHRNENGKYDIVEVKSNSQIKDYHIHDFAFQYKIISQQLEIENVYILHVNNHYRRKKGRLSKKFFLLDNVTEKAQELAKTINLVEISKRLSEEVPPNCKISTQCEYGWDCGYKKHCISKLNQWEKEVVSIEGLTWNQKIKSLEAGKIVYPKNKEVLKLTADEIICRKKEIKEFLDKIQYPLYLLDYESIQHIIPKHLGQKPWSQTPFQYSLHIIKEWGAEIEHRECLVTSNDVDPRKVIVEQLIQDIPANSQVMAYNMAFEKGINKELSEVFPAYAHHLNQINFIDLMEPFKNKDYYQGSMKGSYSIKVVLPTLFPNDPMLDYHHLVDVQNGQQAQEGYTKLMKLNGNEKEALIENMLKYCKLDTFAMVKILAFLYQLVYGGDLMY